MAILPWITVLLAASAIPELVLAQTRIVVQGTPSHDIPSTLCKYRSHQVLYSTDKQ